MPLIAERDAGAARPAAGTWLNDRHSALNRTRVGSVVRPGNLAELVGVVRRAAKEGGRVSIVGNRHAMGGQQFREGGLAIDVRGLNGVICFDVDRGVLSEVRGLLDGEAPMGSSASFSIGLVAAL